MSKEDINKIIEVAENLEWNVTIDGEYFELSKFSPAGQDFNIGIDGVEDIDSLVALLYERYLNFDVSEETYLWLDNSGHGQNGVPYDMKDLYNDMEACQEMILELYKELDIIL
ncbi:MAG TPA: hypothetical protein GXZ90_09940 [Clostridiales bacterium]|nr:hypothetical protein [Clostridiales bacterium]